jgi:hypothetical protein
LGSHSATAAFGGAEFYRSYLTARCGLSDRVTFPVGEALHLPFDDASFDVALLQHVAMNIADRTAP